jgi:hypothetical protein
VELALAIGLKEGVREPFVPNGRARAMPGVHARIVSKTEQDRSYRRNQCRVVAAGQVGPADRACKERIADEQVLPGFAVQAHLQADATRAMTGRVVRARLASPEANHLSLRVEMVDRRLRLDLQSEHRPRLDHALVPEDVIAMQVYRNTERTFRGPHAGDVIDVSMSQQDMEDREFPLLRERQQFGNFVARVDENGFSRIRAGDDKSILEEGSDGSRLY